MKIVLELPYFHGYKRGLDLFFDGFIKNLAERDKTNEYTIFNYSWKHSQAMRDRVTLPPGWTLDIRKWPQRLPIMRPKCDIYMGMTPPADILFLSSAGPKTRQNFTKAMSDHWLNKILPGMEKASKIVVPSEDTKQEIIRSCGVKASKIEVIYWPPSDCMFPYTNPTIGYMEKNTFLVVGPFDRSMNLLPLFNALENIRRQGTEITLICAGLVEDLQVKTDAVIYKGDIQWIGHVDHDELAGLYNAATACVYPSTYEEEGLPLVESMACGTICITGTGGALQEVSQGAAIHIDVTSSQAMERAMLDIIESSPKDIAEAKHQCLERSKAFTWDIAISKYLALFEEVGNQ